MANKTMHHLVIEDNNYEILDAKNRANIAAEYSASSTYNVGDVVLYSGQLYKCTTAIATAEAWTAAHWTAVTVGGELRDLKEEFDQFPNGNYPNMTAGNADQLVSTVFTEDQTPYNFRTTGGSADVGDREYVDSVVGGTVVLNQLIDNASIPATKTESGITFTNNGDGTITVNGTASADVVYAVNPTKSWAAHKYMICGCPKDGSEATYNFAMRGMGADRFDFGNGNIWDATGNTWKGATIYIKSGATVTNLVFKPNIFDLTQTFGSTIADYVYGLETATAGAGVAWLKKYFPKIFDSGYIAHNPGTLVSVEGLSAHKTVGFNQWDEQWEEGSYEVDSITKKVDATRIRTKNVIPVLPSTTYYAKCPTSLGIRFVDADGNYISSATPSNNTFTTPANACGMLFSVVNTTTYNHDICINLSWDGEKDGQYEPYEEHTYPLDDSLTLRGIPKLDTQNNLYYDGDIYPPSGEVQLRFAEITFDGSSDENWVYSATNNRVYIALPGAVMRTGNSIDFISNKLMGSAVIDDYNGYINENGNLVIYAPSSITSASDWKTWLSSNHLFVTYLLNTPTTETAEPYQQTQICDDFGTEEFVSTSPVPVGHNTRYAPNLRAKLEMAPDSPDGDGVYVVQQSNGENTYVPLGSTTTIQSILDRLTALENA